MAGEIWRSSIQIGKETTPGTSVAATRKMYWRNPTLTKTRGVRLHKFSTGTRDNQRAATNGPVEAGGTFEFPMSSSEILEVLNLGISSAPVITTPATGTNTRLHTYKPSAATDTATIEWNDGAREHEEAGVRVNSLTIAGSVNEENVVSGELFGTNLVQAALTAALPDRTPEFIEGWQTKLYIDAFGGTPGTTVVAGTLINWSVTLNNNLGRKYTADNTLAANSVTQGELAIDATLTFEAAATQGLTEFGNFDIATKRLVRLEFQDETGFTEAALRRFVTVDIPGVWTAVDLTGEDAGTRVWQFNLSYVYDATLAAGIQIRAQNMRLLPYV